jgi:hypothetical protein
VGSLALIVVPGEIIDVPDECFRSRFTLGEEPVLWKGKRFFHMAYINLVRPQLKVTVIPVSVSDGKSRQIAFDTYDCLLAFPDLVASAVAGSLDEVWNRQIELRFCRVGAKAALTITHKHAVTREFEGRTYERMDWREPTSNDALEIEQISDSTYRLRMCEDVWIGGRRMIQLGSMVLDVSLHKADEIAVGQLAQKDKRKRPRERKFPSEKAGQLEFK